MKVLYGIKSLRTTNFHENELYGLAGWKPVSDSYKLL